MSNELVLTPPTAAEALSLTLAQQIDAFAHRNAFSGSEVGLIGHMLHKFIAATPLAPALDGEPIFVLRAQDKFAPSHVMAWANDAFRHDCDHAKAEGASVIAAQMLAWQLANPTRVKIPD